MQHAKINLNQKKKKRNNYHNKKKKLESLESRKCGSQFLPERS